MKIACISASNIEPFRITSASTHACQIIGELFQAERPEAQVEIVPLVDYEMKSCRMCGECLKEQRCQRDEAFNQVLEKMISADALFMVIPHYAPFPSKVMILLEKMEEMAFLGWSNDQKNYHSELAGKPMGVIGHGGQIGPEALEYYQKELVRPLATAFQACGFKVQSAGEDAPLGVSFGIQSISMPPGSIFCEIKHDWGDVKQRIAPLVKNVAAALD